LNDTSPPNRAFAMFAVERILGRPLSGSEIDITRGPARRLEQMDRLRITLERKARGDQNR
jgi:hypothetical protein